jgi:S-adenosylmethionine decarboxylase
MKHLLGWVGGVWVAKAGDLKIIMERIAERCGFTVVTQAFHQFEPMGATGVLVLAESHFSAHTYPEDNRIFIDVFCCSENFDPKFCARAIQEEFSAIDGHWRVVDRAPQFGSMSAV